MTIGDPNREQLLRVAIALDDFLTEVVFVGGATLGLLISDAAAAWETAVQCHSFSAGSNSLIRAGDPHSVG